MPKEFPKNAHRMPIESPQNAHRMPNAHCGVLAHMQTFRYRELHIHESHFNKNPYFYQYYLPCKVLICENVWILGKFAHKKPFFSTYKSQKFKKLHFFHGFRNFCKLDLCMVNNSDKSKLFC